HKYKFDVKMTCGGCSGAVNRVLKKAQDNGDGVSEYDVNLEKQEVLVTGTIPYDALLEKIKKTGKEVSLLSTPASVSIPTLVRFALVKHSSRMLAYLLMIN
ncbi:hypothetical protein CPB83DRAFT_758798, partial [Crepidotus variabilis]